MPRQILNQQAQIEKFADQRMAGVEPGVVELAGQRVVGVLIFPGAHQAGQAVQRLRLDAQSFADLPRRRAAAIGDHVGGHGRAQLSVAFVDVLNGAFALISAGQIQIDIRPFAALFGKKALEKQVHADGVHGRNAQRVTHRAIGRRAAALHQNIALAAKADDIPDDQEIAGQIELFDQAQFALDLLAHAFLSSAAV